MKQKISPKLKKAWIVKSFATPSLNVCIKTEFMYGQTLKTIYDQVLKTYEKLQSPEWITIFSNLPQNEPEILKQVANKELLFKLNIPEFSIEEDENSKIKINELYISVKPSNKVFQRVKALA